MRHRKYPHRALAGFRSAATFATLLMLCLTACERQPQRAAAPLAAEEAPTALKLTAAMEAYAQQPAGVATGLFIDRLEPGDLRVVSYNVNWDSIFPDKNQAAAEKFQRVVKALDPDILCLQEIGGTYDEGPKKTSADVVELMNAIDPRPHGQLWRVFLGQSSAVVARYPLSMTTDRLIPSAAPYRDPACALVDLPDERFGVDAYVLNNHFKCCDGAENDPKRQKEADAIVNWLRDARTPGGQIDLPNRTALIITGDLNLVGGPGPLETLLTGDITNEDEYGPDSAPDWDGSDLTDAHPRHNAVGPDDYTWRNDDDEWPPGRLDCIIYSDSVLTAVHKFVLNTTTMSDEELRQARLERCDVTLDTRARHFDHLPVVVDFRAAAP